MLLNIPIQSYSLSICIYLLPCILFHTAISSYLFWLIISYLFWLIINLRHQPFTPSHESMPSNHIFIGVEMDGLHRKCDVCNKKVNLYVSVVLVSNLKNINILLQIWVLKSRVQECQKCGLKCHKKCINYCMKNMPCYRKSFGILHHRSEGEFAIYECEHQTDDMGAGNGHRHLTQDEKQRELLC